MKINPKQLKRFIDIYGVEPASADSIFALIKQAINNRAPFSLVRAGDIVTLVLTEQHDLIRPIVFDFLGIPNPPPPQLTAELKCAISETDVLGPTIFTGRTKIAERLKDYLDNHQIKPSILTWPFICDRLYKAGYIQQLIDDYQVIFVGRSAPIAAEHYNVRAYTLGSWFELDEVEKQLSKDCDLVLVGAGIPGRILCSRLKRQGKVALDIGHIMDALAYPDVWEKSDKVYRRRAFKNALLENRQPVPMVKPTNNYRYENEQALVVYTGTVKSGIKTAFQLMHKAKISKKLKKITKMNIVPGTLNLELNSPLIIKNGLEWSYGFLCPASLNGKPVFVNKRPFFRPNFVTVLSDIYLREELKLENNSRVSLEIQSIYVD
ncbi:MAG: hypothetical protein GX994_08450 [Firmicutes bacterium]|nr:hypothetical protein [Bacillota bacterium]